MNLLFIYTDQQRADTLGAYGNRLIETPNLDRLAAKSVLFESTYVTQSVCTPSRSSLLTGLWPHTNGNREGGNRGQRIGGTFDAEPGNPIFWHQVHLRLVQK